MTIPIVSNISIYNDVATWRLDNLNTTIKHCQSVTNLHHYQKQFQTNYINYKTTIHNFTYFGTYHNI
jgi:hypothetical protein